MNSSDITTMRLANHHLSLPDFITPESVVAHLGAVQAQDYPAAKWSLGLRMKNTTESIVEKAINQGKILRTHVMRPTWHFVMPEDIRWMQSLTAPNVKKLMGHYNRKLELTDELFTKTNKVIIAALGNNQYLTRQELKKLLEEIGIKTDVQRLAHIVMWAELDGLICNGPRRGKQFTYALLDERAPQTKVVSREESLAKLALKYFSSHGPAQIKDFAWWSGLSLKDSNEALSFVKEKLASETIATKTYWFSSAKKAQEQTLPKAYLLSIFDEYTIAYKDRTALSEKRDIERMISMGNALLAVIILDGKVVGAWKRLLKKDRVVIQLSPFREREKAEYTALEQAAKRYSEFIELPTETVLMRAK
ncbi:MAG: winged helix DNA-binding domain-containing protein [Patescibacteria group bacterium]